MTLNKDDRKLVQSPFGLLQEIYWPDEWKILVSCMFLNQTGRKQVDSMREAFFAKWPDAEAASKADQFEMAEAIKSLGFKNRRSRAIIRMSQEFLQKEWVRPIELHGIGQYAQDSYDIFINGIIVDDPADHVLHKYVKWLKEESKRNNLRWTNDENR